MTSHPNDNVEFTDTRLVEIYDAVNPVDGYAGFCLDLAVKLKARRVVDLGCGTGLLTQQFIDSGFEVVGIEPSQMMLDRAMKRDVGHQAEWLNGSAELVAGRDADLVLMTGHVAQFFLDDEGWLAALASIRDGLRGHLLFDARNPLVPPFASWPTADSPRTVSTPRGPVQWWHSGLNLVGRLANYDLSYRFPSGETVTSSNKLVFRTKAELKEQLHSSGLFAVSEFGDWDGAQAGPDSQEMIFLVKTAA